MEANKLDASEAMPSSRLSQNSWVTDPNVPDPDNLPKPLGYTILVRPYPIKQNKKISNFALPDQEVDYMNQVTNIARVVSVGPCCWNTSDKFNRNGEAFDWVKVGDFITFPKNVGSKRKFKGVSYVLLVDDEINEKLPDPQVFDNSVWTMDIPEDHLIKYNTIKNPQYKESE